MFTRHKFLLVAVKEWLKSVLNYRSYPENKTGYPFFGPPCTWLVIKTVVKQLKLFRWSAINVDFLGRLKSPATRCDLEIKMNCRRCRA